MKWPNHTLKRTAPAFTLAARTACGRAAIARASAVAELGS
jgi:hypothetical protein